MVCAHRSALSFVIVTASALFEHSQGNKSGKQSNSGGENSSKKSDPAASASPKKGNDHAEVPKAQNNAKTKGADPNAEFLELETKVYDGIKEACAQIRVCVHFVWLMYSNEYDVAFFFFFFFFLIKLQK